MQPQTRLHTSRNQRGVLARLRSQNPPRRFGGGGDLMFALPHAQARSQYVHARESLEDVIVIVALGQTVAAGEVDEAECLSHVYI
ncbi:uncharacterized protein BO66DRAFT_435851 [Aspergillus aculeatinus CBS 121060]|uniref:Uncharacterized protein n=1 Tax=Aspergillus aculeatinus CBS 121060 TaxID=1448322 RepID=A0ACD1HHA8_9EURO|nr:hypothetical protein BO66DRAFT_435851 [Aspergillus aculeatinus CBS 121060]RAH72956.1 hypothetical protein BO66DRAFT_435851 [Aspergillus aculeatinus CBS 121060]